MAKDNELLSGRLKRLKEIVAWFESREEVDVEEGLVKAKEGAILVKELKSRLKEAENEFKEIKKDLADN